MTQEKSPVRPPHGMLDYIAIAIAIGVPIGYFMLVMNLPRIFGH